MKENSIEEDIKILEKKINDWEPYKNINFHTSIEKEISIENEAIEHILSDYKRVLKENEEWQRAYQEEKDKQFDLIKENEELKVDNYELNNRITDLLENIPVQKIKDLMGEKEWAIKSYDCSEADYNQSQAVGAWFACQRLLEERKK